MLYTTAVCHTKTTNLDTHQSINVLVTSQDNLLLLLLLYFSRVARANRAKQHTSHTREVILGELLRLSTAAVSYDRRREDMPVLTHIPGTPAQQTVRMEGTWKLGQPKPAHIEGVHSSTNPVIRVSKQTRPIPVFCNGTFQPTKATSTHNYSTTAAAVSCSRLLLICSFHSGTQVAVSTGLNQHNTKKASTPCERTGREGCEAGISTNRL